MILLTIDPLTKTAGMMSIPRDMWVNIPGHGYSRINTAYSSGEGEKLPGGGPELARKTVENFIGVPIQYYAQIDFDTFVQFIDLIGCIQVDVPETLTLDKQGSGNDHFTVKAGNDRRLCGERALAYVRYRKDKEGDVGRSKRQQAVILAIREKVLAPENFPVLLGEAQDFYNQFSAGIKTNMPFDIALRLGVLAKDIPISSIQQGVIDYTMVALDNTTLGGQDASVMKPFPDKIRELRDKIFTTGGPVSPLAATGDPTALMQADGARVRMLNGTYTPGLDVTTGNYFLTQGMGVTEVGSADQVYDNTIIVLYKPKLYTMKYLQAVFGITSGAQIRIQPDPSQTVDVEVRLGNNWAANNPMPK
jgi:LCP family protein required for cell wall assembly